MRQPRGSMVRGATLAVVGLVFVANAWAQSELDTEQWKEWRTKLFADRPIQEDATGVFQFDVPTRPESGAACRSRSRSPGRSRRSAS